MNDALNGLSSKEHNNIDVSAILTMAYDVIDHLDTPTIIDVGSGGGRDIASLQDRLKGKGRFISVDYDAVRGTDALDNFPNRFILTDKEDTLEAITDKKKIAFLNKDILSLDLPEQLRADFILSMAVGMFIAPDDIDDYVGKLVDNAKPNAHILHMHSTWRPEQEDESKQRYPNGYHHYSASQLSNIFEAHGASVVKEDIIPDAAGRGFDWYVLDVVVQP